MSARRLATIALIALGSTYCIMHSFARDEPATQPTTQPSAAKEALDRELPEINFQGVPVKDAFEFLHDITQVELDVDWAALSEAGVKVDAPVTLKSKGKSLSTVIDEVLRQLHATAPLACKPDGDVIRISTKEDLKNK